LNNIWKRFMNGKPLGWKGDEIIGMPRYKSTALLKVMEVKSIK